MIRLLILSLFCLALLVPDVGANGGLFSRARSRSRSVEKVRVEKVQIQRVEVQKIQRVEVEKVKVIREPVLVYQSYSNYAYVKQPPQAFYQQSYSNGCPPAVMGYANGYGQLQQQVRQQALEIESLKQTLQLAELRQRSQQLQAPSPPAK